ncbi:type IV secretory system conjugative DNA transfer family protein [Arthrobacter sp. B0490]|uniref:type IV secretory system conjugative DNA transfer family protein n=1 Tax=Arthrobacter sp. B0490 TaxID=2058891 RepID=UPI000CE4C853|nr:type IV secretory system conjugative DNA transfer family protein [Arthrobacter sp. B0490]
MRNEENASIVLFSSVVLAAFIAVALIHLGDAFTPVPTDLSWNPITLAIGFATGDPWPAAASWLLGAEAVVVIAAFAWWSTRPVSRTAGASRRMSPGGRMRPAMLDARLTEAARLHPTAEGIGPGLTIGYIGETGTKAVIQGWRECSTHVWGTGRGKTTTQVVRHATEAPGAYIMTSNKVDGVAEVIAARTTTETRTGTVWLFDPQRIWRDSHWPAMIFNPLTSVTDTVSAGEIASIFETSSAPTAGQGKGDAQFDSQGRDFLSWCLLAAAKGDGTMKDVLRWISSADFMEPADLLERAGHAGPASALKGMSAQPEDTRGSVAASAQRMASALVHDELMAWSTPTPGVPVFDPIRFVASRDTLILLTQDAAGSGAAFVSTLVYAVFTAAQQAARHAGGRLPVPLVADLDEVGNVVKLKQLPEWYSYFGSMGIVVSAYFQTRGQGMAMLERTGWDTLWSAAAIKVYGGGSDDTAFLESLSKTIGQYDAKVRSTSTSRNGSSRSVQTQRRDIMSVAQLSELPANRAWVKTSNGGGTIVRTVPWFRDKTINVRIGPTVERIKTSKAGHLP